MTGHAIRLGPRRTGCGARRTDGPVELERGGARVLVRVDRRRATRSRPSRRTRRARSSSSSRRAKAAPCASAPTLPDLVPLPVPPRHRFGGLSYSALALFERCSYRFYAERIVGHAPDGRRAGLCRAGQTGSRRPRSATPSTCCSRSKRRRPRCASGCSRATRPRRTRTWSGSSASSPPGTARRSLGGSPASNGRRARAALRLRARRRPAARALRRLAPASEGRALVVDYKTNRLEELSPAEARRGTSTRCSGSSTRSPPSGPARTRSRSPTSSSSVPTSPSSATFARAEVPALEAELSAADRSDPGGQFRPTPSEFACPGCPALDVVCAGPALGGARRQAWIRQRACAGPS